MPGLYEDSALATAAHVLTRGPLSRADVARDLGLSGGTLTRLVRPMIDAGLMRDDRIGASSSGMGRPTQLLEIPAADHLFIGVNVTATAVHAVLTDARARILHTAVAPIMETAPTSVAALIERSVAGLVAAAAVDPARLRGAGVSAGGPVQEGVILHNRFLGWEDVEFSALLGRRGGALDGLPRTMANDVVALTTLEQWFGLGLDLTDFLLVTVGAGVGHGMVHGRRVVVSPLSGYGVTSHLPVWGAHGVCHYGHVGCADGALTTPAVLARARGGRAVERDDGRPADLADLADLALAGDAAARRAVGDFGRDLAVYLQEVGAAAMVSDVVLDGEGVTLLDCPAASTFGENLESFRSPRMPPLRVHRRSGTFDRWAQGAACTAIVTWLESQVPRRSS